MAAAVGTVGALVRVVTVASVSLGARRLETVVSRLASLVELLSISCRICTAVGPLDVVSDRVA
jgi:hypothetical protein